MASIHTGERGISTGSEVDEDDDRGSGSHEVIDTAGSMERGFRHVSDPNEDGSAHWKDPPVNDHVAFLKMPNEVMHGILRVAELSDIESMFLSCIAMNRFIHKNDVLYRDLVLQRLEASPVDDVPWEHIFHVLAKMDRVKDCDDRAKKMSQLTFMANSIRQILQCLPAGNESLKTVNTLENYFESESDQLSLLCQSRIFRRARGDSVQTPYFSHRRPSVTTRSPSDSKHNLRPRPRRDSKTQNSEDAEQCQASAMLNCYRGVPVSAQISSVNTYPYACSVMYDLRQHNFESLWGPFLSDGKASVDWEKVEAIMTILNYNIQHSCENHQSEVRALKDLWTNPFHGVAPNSFRSDEATKIIPGPRLNPEDPYNVAGTYDRIICFLDFSELYHYNFSTRAPSAGLPRPPLNTGEATRVISMELRVTDIAYPGDEKHVGHGVAVYFIGTSWAKGTEWDQTTHSGIRGVVQTTEAGEVRWTSYSIFFGRERWKSEGVQIGGANSGRGVFGTWFDKHYSEEGPVGPSAFWKVSNEIDESRPYRYEPQFDSDEDEDEDDD